MCLLGYKFNVLDNAFLVRRFTQFKNNNKGDNIAEKNEYKKIKHRINIELTFLYGHKNECII